MVRNLGTPIFRMNMAIKGGMQEFETNRFYLYPQNYILNMVHILNMVLFCALSGNNLSPELPVDDLEL